MSRQSQISSDAIKETARAQMRKHGTAGLTLRGIARDLGVTAPAIYNYFPRMDDLITALIVDAFNALADCMIDASSTTGTSISERIFALTLAYRDWALQHPIDFQLIYGNPIPGYEAPGEITIPLANRPFQRLFELFGEAWQRGEAHLPAGDPVPPSILAHIETWRPGMATQLPPEAVAAIVAGWGRMHGLVMLELTGHSPPVVGDTDAFYRHEIIAYLKDFGLKV